MDNTEAITELAASMKKYIEDARVLNECAAKATEEHSDERVAQLIEIKKYQKELDSLTQNQEETISRLKKRSAQKREARLVDEIVKLADKIRNAQVALNDAIELELQVINDYAIAGESNEERFGESKDECINRHKELVVDADYTVKSLKREMRLLAQ